LGGCKAESATATTTLELQLARVTKTKVQQLFTHAAPDTVVFNQKLLNSITPFLTQNDFPQNWLILGKKKEGWHI